MPLNDPWDWVLLNYTATVLLNRSEKEFWKMTPRKLNALSDLHIKINANDKKGTNPRPGYIDQIM